MKSPTLRSHFGRAPEDHNKRLWEFCSNTHLLRRLVTADLLVGVLAPCPHHTNLWFACNLNARTARFFSDGACLPTDGPYGRTFGRSRAFRGLHFGLPTRLGHWKMHCFNRVLDWSSFRSPNSQENEQKLVHKLEVTVFRSSYGTVSSKRLHYVMDQKVGLGPLNH